MSHICQMTYYLYLSLCVWQTRQICLTDRPRHLFAFTIKDDKLFVKYCLSTIAHNGISSLLVMFDKHCSGGCDLWQTKYLLYLLNIVCCGAEYNTYSFTYWMFFSILTNTQIKLRQEYSLVVLTTTPIYHPLSLYEIVKMCCSDITNIGFNTHRYFVYHSFPLKIRVLVQVSPLSICHKSAYLTHWHPSPPLTTPSLFLFQLLAISFSQVPRTTGLLFK
jgi:hypothetical protein